MKPEWFDSPDDERIKHTLSADGKEQVQVFFKGHEIIKDVMMPVSKSIIFILLNKSNVYIHLHPDTKKFCLVGYDDDTEINKSYVKQHNMIPMADVIEEYAKAVDIEIDPKTELVAVGHQIWYFIQNSWLRSGNLGFGFRWDSMTKELYVGLAEKMDMNMTTALVNSIERYRINENGTFWDRNWVRESDLDKTQGGGKNG